MYSSVVVCVSCACHCPALCIDFREKATHKGAQKGSAPSVEKAPVRKNKAGNRKQRRVKKGTVNKRETGDKKGTHVTERDECGDKETETGTKSEVTQTHTANSSRTVQATVKLFNRNNYPVLVFLSSRWIPLEEWPEQTDKSNVLVPDTEKYGDVKYRFVDPKANAQVQCVSWTYVCLSFSSLSLCTCVLCLLPLLLPLLSPFV